MQKKEASSLLKPIGKILKKFHLLIFFVFIVGCLAFAVVTTSAIVAGEDTTNNLPSSNASGGGSFGGNNGGSASTIDKTALQEIQALKPSTDPSTYTPVQGVRHNPFAE